MSAETLTAHECHIKFRSESCVGPAPWQKGGVKVSLQLALALILAAAGWSGCTTERPGLVLAPVGPAVVPASTSKADGQLLVFSAHDPEPHFNSLPYEVFYTDYVLVAPDSKPRTIHNNPNPSVPGPTPVPLPAGAYRVIARANGYGTVTVPVVIAPHQTTTVRLDSEGTWQPALAGTNVVRLPDGEIVGCSAVPIRENGRPEVSVHQ
jgi:hypothetical protein